MDPGQVDVEEEPSPNTVDHQLFQSYKLLNQKLSKKRFVFSQRSNTEEGLTEVLAWIEQAKRLGDDSYAAFATLAAARCEQALGNPSKQALHLTNAGHAFFALQGELEETKALNFEQNLAHAIDCYLVAIRIHSAQKRDTQAGALYYEMALLLEKMGRPMEAATYFQDAARLQLKYSPMSALTSYQHAARCFVAQRDYGMAANTYHLIISQIPSLAIDPHDLEEVDVNEKKSSSTAVAATAAAMSPKRSSARGPGSPPPSREASTAAADGSRKDQTATTTMTTGTTGMTYMMPMDSFYTRALSNAKVCLLLLHLLQKQHAKARALLRDVAPAGEEGATTATAAADRLVFTPPPGELEAYPFLAAPGWSDSLHFALYSAIAMCETRDEGIAEEVKRELWPFLDRAQWDLFQLILLDLHTADVVYG